MVGFRSKGLSDQGSPCGGNGFALPFFMTPILEAEANLTAQNQITIPAPIRRALKLRAGKSRVKFQIIPDEGKVLVVLVGPPPREKEDPALKPFLNLLTRDIKENPRRIRPFPVDLLNRARSVVENVEVDLKGPLTGED
jgi:antitoxin PrlF